MSSLYNLVKKQFAVFALTIALLLVSFSGFASHIVGADLSYTWISGNDYKVTFVAYGDCGPASAAIFAQLPNARPEVCVYDGGTYYRTMTLTIDTPNTPYRGKEITPVCPADSASTQCTNTSFSIPGIKKFVYVGTITLPRVSHNWRFIFNGGMGATGAGRAAAITNIAGGTSIQLIDSLDNYYHNNSSPALTVVPTPFFCLNNNDSYNPGAVDPEGDSMRFYLVAGTNGTNRCSAIGGPVTYIGGYTATAPLAVASATFNNATGQFDFYPNALQRSLVVYNIVEYRNDTFIGTSQREMTFLVLTCTTPPPTGSFTSSSAGTILDSTHFSVCSGTGAFTVTLTPTEADTSNRIKVTYSGLPAGATFTTVNDSTNHPICTFSWTTTSVAPGTYTFFVTFKDDACPLNGVRTNSYTIIIAPLPTVDAGPAVAICLGSSTVLNPSGAATYTWAPPTGLSCTACTSPTASPATTTTYTVTGTSAAGCVNTDTVTVIVLPVPGVISGTSPICAGSTSTLTDTAAGGRWSSSATGIATISTTGVVTGVTGGSCTITYMLPNGCYVTMPFVVNPMPTAIGGPISVCVGSTITETNGVAGGTWTTSDATIASIESGTGVVYGVVTGTVTITYTLPAGCFVTRTITVNPLPSPITGITTICARDTTTLRDSTAGGTWSTSSATIASIVSSTGLVYAGNTGGTATITYTLPTGCYVTTTMTINPLPSGIGGPAYLCVGNTTTLTSGSGGSWSTSNSSIASVDASTGVVYGVSAGTCNITYTLPTGCYRFIAVTVNPLPSAINGPTVVCVAATITLTDSLSGGRWTSASTGIASINPTTGVVYGVAAGTVTISYTITATGCYITTTITVNPLPNAGTIGGPTQVCVGRTINMSETVTGGTWSNSFSSIASISTSGVVYGVAAGTDTIKYSVTNSCGTAIARYVITVVAFPTAGTISGPTNVCENASVTFTNAITGGVWTSANTSIAVVSASGLVTGVAAGTTLISYAVTNICGTAYATKSITVDPIPTITITPATPDYCIGGSTPLTASGAVSYTWAPGTALTATAGTTVTANPTTTTVYTVTGRAANGCFNTGMVTVTVHPLPTLTIPNTTMCYGFPTTLTVAGANTYVWSPSSSLSAGTGNSVIANPSDTITYTIVGTDIFGCVNTTTVTVNVNPIPPAPLVVTPVNYCMTAASVPLVATGTSLLWYTTVTGGTGSSTAITPSTAAVGVFHYYVTQTVDGCESPRADITVNVENNAETDFDYKIYFGCTFDTVVFTNTSQFCYRYEWSFGDGSRIDTSFAPTHYYLPAHVPTNYTVILRGFNRICFPDSTIKVLTLIPDPNPRNVITSVTSNRSISLGESVQLDAEGGYVFRWTPNDGSLNNPNVNNPIASPTVTTTYYVYAYDKTGCMDSSQVTITVNDKDDEFVPSAFSPNGDGKNDVFRISHLRFNKLVEFSVYNRWGERVFHTANIEEGWDGWYKTEPQDMGVYNYFIIVGMNDGRTKTYKGTVTLVR